VDRDCGEGWYTVDSDNVQGTETVDRDRDRGCGEGQSTVQWTETVYSGEGQQEV
jgi:hypothetical protein